MATPAFVHLDDLLQYQKKELSAQAEEKRVKIAKAKKVAGGSKAKQKEVSQTIEDEYAPLEKALKDRQKQEVDNFGKGGEQEQDQEEEEEEEGSAAGASAEQQAPSLAVASLSLSAAAAAAAAAPLPPPRSKEEEEELKRQKAVAKAQEKKAKKKAKDADVEAQRAAELEKAASGPSNRQLESDAIARSNNFDGANDSQLLLSIAALRRKAGDSSFDPDDAFRPESYVPLTPEEHLLSLHVGPKVIVDVPADGNCLFRSVATQMQPAGTTFVHLRSVCAKALIDDSEDFEPFAEVNDGETFDDYVRTVGDSVKAEWGGELELRALANALGRNIVVFEASAKPIVIRPKKEDAAEGKPDIWVSYHKQYYALGEHYNAVKRA